jgi:hypothetical protein
LEEHRDALRAELLVYSEMLARVLHVTGPVVVQKDQKPDPAAVVDVNFHPSGDAVIIELKVPNA